MYGDVSRVWELPPLSPLLVPYSGVWHVSPDCPAAHSPSADLHWAPVSQVASGLCTHCALLITVSLSFARLTGSSTDWVVSPIAEALLAVLLYSVATSKIVSPQGLPGWITETARQAQSALGGSPVIEEALKMSSKKRHALLSRGPVSRSAHSSLVAPFESRAGGTLLLSDTAYTKDSFVVLPYAATRVSLEHPAARRALQEAIPVGATDRATLDLFVSLLESGLDERSASRAAVALLGHGTQYA